MHTPHAYHYYWCTFSTIHSPRKMKNSLPLFLGSNMILTRVDIIKGKVEPFPSMFLNLIPFHS